MKVESYKSGIISVDGKKSMYKEIDGVGYLCHYVASWPNDAAIEARLTECRGKSGFTRFENLGPVNGDNWVDVVKRRHCTVEDRGTETTATTTTETETASVDVEAVDVEAVGLSAEAAHWLGMQGFKEAVSSVAPKQAEMTKTYRFELPNKKVEMKGEKNEALVKAAAVLLSGLHVYLYGPAGCGKTYFAQKFAKNVNLPLYTLSNVQDIYSEIKGYYDANGNYVESIFYKAWKNGGVLLFDEFDSSDANSITALNVALANGYYDFPCGRVEQSENFYCIAAGNTCGTGATEEYSSRNRLDAATLDRFFVIEVDYSTDVEKAIEAKGIINGKTEFVESLRPAFKSCGINIPVSYRTIETFTRLEAGGALTARDMVFGAVTKGLDTDSIKQVVNAYNGPYNMWYDGLLDLSK